MTESGNSISRMCANIFGWSIGAALFAALSPAATLLRWRRYFVPPESAESHHEGGHRVDLHVGVLPMNVNEEILYSVPSEIPPTARAIQIEASIPLHDEACTREYELYPDSDVADKISFYLFTKPFPANPQISFSMTSFWIAPARDRRFLLTLRKK